MSLFEEEHGTYFDTVVMHDAEDLIHPHALFGDQPGARELRDGAGACAASSHAAFGVHSWNLLR